MDSVLDSLVDRLVDSVLDSLVDSVLDSFGTGVPGSIPSLGQDLSFTAPSSVSNPSVKQRKPMQLPSVWGA